MPAETLAENEYLIIREIAKTPSHTQRSLSHSVGLSLGTTNLLVRRLSRKGYIKVTQLDWKRARYLLTLKGALEKTRKTYHYTLYTLRIFRQIQENIATLLRKEYEAGRRRFILVAQDEILDLLRDAVRELEYSDASFEYLRRFEDVPRDTDLVLTATPEPLPPHPESCRFISLVDFNDISFRLR